MPVEAAAAAAAAAAMRSILASTSAVQRHGYAMPLYDSHTDTLRQLILQITPGTGIGTEIQKERSSAQC